MLVVMAVMGVGQKVLLVVVMGWEIVAGVSGWEAG